MVSLIFYRENLNGLLKMWDHCGFLMPDQKSVSLMAQFNPNVFNYQITFKDTFSFTNYFKPGIDSGPSHADDLYYMVVYLHSINKSISNQSFLV